MINFIKLIVAKQFNTTTDKYDSNKRRKTNDVVYRQICMYTIDRNLEMTLQEIGEIFDKTHATVLHAKKTINNYLTWDKDLKKNVDEIQQLISLKTHALFHESDLSEQFYYIDMNNFTSLRISSSKSILMTGLTEEEQLKVQSVLAEFNEVKPRVHEKTNMYVFEENALLKDNKEHNETNENKE